MSSIQQRNAVLTKPITQASGNSPSHRVFAAKQNEPLPELPGSGPGNRNVLTRKMATAKLIWGKKDCCAALQDIDKWANQHLQQFQKLDPAIKDEFRDKENLESLRKILREFGYSWVAEASAYRLPITSTINNVSSLLPEEALCWHENYHQRATQTEEGVFPPWQGLPLGPVCGDTSTGPGKSKEQNLVAEAVPRNTVPEKELESRDNRWPVGSGSNMPGEAGKGLSPYEELSKQVEILRDGVKQRNDYIRALESLVTNQEENIQQLTDDLMAVKITTNHIIDDQELDKMWNGLHYKIDQWVSVRVHLFKDMTETSMDNYQSIFRQLCEDPFKWTTKSLYRPVLFQAYIWKLLLFHVFNEDQSLWTDELVGIGMGFMRYHMKAAVAQGRFKDAEYHQWRSSTAATIHRVFKTDEKRIRTLAADMEQSCCGRSLGDNQYSSPSLFDIVKDAVELDRLLLFCRADYRIFMYNLKEDTSFSTKQQGFNNVDHYGFDYSDTSMTPAIQGTAYAPSKSNMFRVAFVVSPGIVKYGDHEGENYHNSKVISRRRVICNKFKVV